ncbi:Cytochrome b-c1 complex subunit 7, partial [Spiromyces aspiralis]
MASLVRTLQNNSALRAILRPFANAWVNAAGYRRLGLLYDDIIIEDTPEAEEALRRLPVHVTDARA